MNIKLILLIHCLIFTLFFTACEEEKVPEPAAKSVSFIGSELLIHKDASLTVTDTLIVLKNKKDSRYGMIRRLPGKMAGGVKDLRDLEYTVLNSRHNGLPSEAKTKKSFGDFFIYWGMEEAALEPGKHEFLVQYKVKNLLSSHSDHVRLVWSITGGAYRVPVDSIVVLVKLPVYVPRTFVMPSLKRSYTGKHESPRKDYEYTILKNGTIKFWTTKRLEPYEHFVIDLSFPRGFVAGS